jgi:hypothetical protein
MTTPEALYSANQPKSGLDRPFKKTFNCTRPAVVDGPSTTIAYQEKTQHLSWQLPGANN